MKKFLFLFLFLIFGNLNVFANSLEDNYDYWKSEECNYIKNFVYSFDWNNFAFVCIKSHNYSLIKDWKKYLEYYEDEDSENTYKITNWNKELVEESDEISYPAFSPDWKSFSFVLEKSLWDDKYELYIVKDWLEIKTNYHNIYDLIYSPNWKGLTFIATDKDNKFFIVKDWVEWKKYDEISSYKYSPDWKDFIFIARKNDSSIIVKNWIEWSKKYSYINNLQFSPDSKSVSFETNVIVKDWIEIYWNGLIYSTDSKNFSYTVRKNWKSAIIKDWIEISWYDETSYPAYSSDWKSFSFSAMKNWKAIIVKDWVEILKNDGVGQQFYSPDSKNFWYFSLKKWKWVFIYNDLESYEFNELTDEFFFSPNSKSFSFIHFISDSNKWKLEQIVQYKEKSNIKNGSNLNQKIILKIKKVADKYKKTPIIKLRAIIKTKNMLIITEKESLRYEILNELLNQLKN